MARARVPLAGVLPLDNAPPGGTDDEPVFLLKAGEVNQLLVKHRWMSHRTVTFQRELPALRVTLNIEAHSLKIYYIVVPQKKRFPIHL